MSKEPTTGKGSLYLFLSYIYLAFALLHGCSFTCDPVNSHIMASTGPDSFAPAVGADSGEHVGQKVAHTMESGGAEEAYKAEKDGDQSAGEAAGWSLLPDVQAMAANDTTPGKALGVTWNDLTVTGISSGAVMQENVLSQFNIPKQAKESRGPKPLKTIINKSSGCVKPGEMLLVLGRPGSGCTTLLKMLANHRKGYEEVTGDVKYGSMDHKQAEQFRGQIVINNEEEVFYPSLTVGRTMDFATRLKVPSTLPKDTNSHEDYRKNYKQFLMESMGISHTEGTKVGNEFIRGVSGGERKRVSIIETLATRSSVACWDNSTRGLDASTALEYTKALRAMTDEFQLTTIVTLYQAGNGIYELFDKVLVLDEGEQLYYGPRAEARPFMESQGFVCGAGANVADFLTGVTVPNERQVKPGFESRFPRNASELRQAYEASNIKERMYSELDFPASAEAESLTKVC